MSKIEFVKLEKLTAEDINKLIIHSTRSSIRRAADSKPTITIPGDENVPTLYYILDVDKDTQEEYYSIHALSSDVTKFLLLNQIASSESDENTDSESGTDSETENESEGTDNSGDTNNEGNEENGNEVETPTEPEVQNPDDNNEEPVNPETGD